MRSVIGKNKFDDKRESPSLLPQQLEIALQIASAMKYLHEKRVIFRDLKPANLGEIDTCAILLLCHDRCQQLITWGFPFQKRI